MVCPHCQGVDALFDDSYARKDLKSYLKKGPGKSTRLLLDALRRAGIEGMSLLDIGGGVGAIQHELVAAGVAASVDVDGSSAYLQAARSEAAERGYLERADYIHGDFVQIAHEVETADIVTLDKVVCCYPDAQALVTLSAERANRYYALVYPRDFALVRWLMPIVNFLAFRMRGNPFRAFIHSTAMIDALVQERGLTRIFHQNAGVMQVFVYERAS